VDSVHRVLLELTVKKLRKGLDPRSKSKSKVLKTKFSRIDKDGTAHFVTPSGTHPTTTKWKQKIQISELPAFFKDKNSKLTSKARVVKALKKDVKVMCDCPAFKFWGYKYITTQLGSSLENETRPPNIRNPKRRGTVCKHLEVALRVLPFHSPDITRKMKSVYVK